jgi:hypothetical protein
MFFLWHFRVLKENVTELRNNIGKYARYRSTCDLQCRHRRGVEVVYMSTNA